MNDSIDEDRWRATRDVLDGLAPYRRLGDVYFLSSPMAAELRRHGFEDLLDRAAELVTSVDACPSCGQERLEACWILARSAALG